MVTFEGFHNNERPEEFGYNDILVGNRYIDFILDDVDFTTKFSRNIKLKLPLVSSPMDTVTNYRVAIIMALKGGLGVIHFNDTIDDQKRAVELVKRYESGFIENPITLHPDAPISEAYDLAKSKNIRSIPITHDGKPHGMYKGLLFTEDYVLGVHANLPVIDRILETRNTIHWSELDNDKLGSARQELAKIHQGSLPILDDDGTLKYLVSKTDLDKLREYPDSTRDKDDRLMVAAAVGTHKSDYDRVDALVEAGVDALIFDSSNGWSKFEKKIVKEKLKQYGDDIDFVLGNTAEPEGVKQLLEWGAHALRIGSGPGRTCISARRYGSGRYQGSAVYYCSKVGGPIIADGGIEFPGDVMKALALGAETVMMGTALAGVDESAAPTIEIDGEVKKLVRGMGSKSAIKRSRKVAEDRYAMDDIDLEKGLIGEEGIEKAIPLIGPLEDYLDELSYDLKKAFQKVGARNISGLRDVTIRKISGEIGASPKDRLPYPVHGFKPKSE